MRAVVLSAGKGTHLGELTVDKPKPMIEVGGHPILEYVLAGLKRAGFSEIIIVVGYHGEKIREFFKDGGDWGLNITYLNQSVQDGTGSAIELTEPLLKEESFFVAYGDIVTEVGNYSRVKDLASSEPCQAVLGVRDVEEPWRGATVYVDREMNVLNIVEKPAEKTTRSRWICAGLFVFSPEVFEYLERLTPSSRGEFELPSAIQMMIDENKKVKAVPLEGVWLDFPSPEEITTSESVVRELSLL